MTDAEQEMTAEIAAVKTELAGLKQEREALLSEVASGKNTAQELEQTLAERESDITALKQSLEDGEKRLLEVNETLAQAVAGYRALIVEHNPGVLAERGTRVAPGLTCTARAPRRISGRLMSKRHAAGGSSW